MVLGSRKGVCRELHSCETLNGRFTFVRFATTGHRSDGTDDNAAIDNALRIKL